MSGYLEELGEPQEQYDAEDFKEKKKAISPFDFANSINYTKELLIVDDWSEKQYNSFIVNKALSYGPDTVVAANEMNSRPHLNSKMQYDFLLSVIRKKKRFNKWLKPEREAKLDIIKEYYGYNNVRAQEALRILSDEDISSISRRLNRGGT
ncbi:MAG: hypothetical protein CBB97_21370 [Candidatus Endolissoclinum sp. TMED37]|nr:MAG: hypothetical protein CBB97_21370 [Candidatus Endolissoclinum sp. TMED37]